MHPHAFNWLQSKLPLFRGTADRPVLRARRAQRSRLEHWTSQLRCFALGHVWRGSHSMQGFETCARCRLRRLRLY
jgi:hypothetical protein